MTETPSLRVVRGRPTAEELAVLVAVLRTRAAAPPPAARPRSAWADPARRLGLAYRPGAAAWRRSGLPA